MDSVFCNRSDN